MVLHVVGWCCMLVSFLWDFFVTVCEEKVIDCDGILRLGVCGFLGVLNLRFFWSY